MCISVTAAVDKFKTACAKFLQDSVYQKLWRSVYSWPRYSKRTFLRHCVQFTIHHYLNTENITTDTKKHYCQLGSVQHKLKYHDTTMNLAVTRMWANAQRDGRPVEHRWRPLFNAANFSWRPLLECRAVTLPRRKTSWNLQGYPKLTKRSQPLVGQSSPYYGDMWRRYCCLTSFFSNCRYIP